MTSLLPTVKFFMNEYKNFQILIMSDVFLVNKKKRIENKENRIPFTSFTSSCLT